MSQAPPSWGSAWQRRENTSGSECCGRSRKLLVPQQSKDGVRAGVLRAVCAGICRVNSFRGHKQHRDIQKIVTCSCCRTKKCLKFPPLLPSWKLSRTGVKSPQEGTQLRRCKLKPTSESHLPRTCQSLYVDIRGLRSTFSALFFLSLFWAQLQPRISTDTPTCSSAALGPGPLCHRHTQPEGGRRGGAGCWAERQLGQRAGNGAGSAWRGEAAAQPGLARPCPDAKTNLGPGFHHLGRPRPGHPAPRLLESLLVAFPVP